MTILELWTVMLVCSSLVIFVLVVAAIVTTSAMCSSQFTNELLVGACRDTPPLKDGNNDQ